MRVRMKDIAARAGVSETAVSLVLNDKPTRISEEKKKEIKKIAAELNYRPNMLARGLATNSTKTIGLIVPDLENSFFASLAKEVSQILYQDNYFTIIENSNDHQKLEFSLIEELINIGVDGLLIALSNESFLEKEKVIAHLASLSIPYILLDRNYQELSCDQVYFDNRRGGYLATQHLLELGHRQIGFLKAPDYIENANERFLGYRAALEEYGVEFSSELVATGDYKFVGGYEKSLKLLENKKLTALVTANDMMLFGVLKRAQELNRKIPEELSVVGYDHSQIAQMYPIKITTIEQDVVKLSRKACGLLKNNLIADKQRYDNQQICLEPKLIIGETTIGVDSVFN